MTIKLRMFSSAAVAILASVLLGVGGFLAVTYLGGSLQKNATAIEALRHSMHADMMHDALRADVFRAILARETGKAADFGEAKKELAEHGADFREQLRELERMDLDADMQEAVAQVLPALEQYIQSAERIARMAGSDVQSARVQLPEFQGAFENLVGPMEALGETIEKFARESQSSATSRVNAFRFAMLVGALVATGILVTISVLLLRAVLLPLAQAVAVSGAIAEGVLDSRIEIARPDEMGRLLSAMKQMQDTLKSVMLGVKNVVVTAASGDFSARVTASGAKGCQHELCEDVNSLLETSENALKDVSRVLSALAEGDLTKRVDKDYQGLFARLKDDANKTSTQLGNIVARIKAAANSINIASKEIASGNSDLSQRTEEQASSLEETASSMEELGSTVKQNAENARQANQLAVGASDVAVRGGEVVREVVQTMGGISESSRKIADIIGVIDGIAFQTNILALNAAVEAARAGEQGRGFAVVASEVRNLAQRSASAAKEIKALIEDSVGKVDAGAKQVNTAGETMEEIVSSVKRVTDIMAEITAASAEQSEGIGQVSAAVGQMDEVTQQNAALVEQAAAAAESLREETEALVRTVLEFRLEEDAEFVRRVQALGREFMSGFGAGFSRSAASDVMHDGKKLPGLKSGNRVISGSNDAVDAFSGKNGAVATIFAVQGDEFVRVATSVRDEHGRRALGTTLDRAHPAFDCLRDAQSFDGSMVLFSSPYMTHYEPIMDSGRNVIGAAFVGIHMDSSVATNARPAGEVASRPATAVERDATGTVAPARKLAVAGGDDDWEEF